ncbi:sugar ABC transporter permease [Rugosimonospora acidiphila]|uniref:Sugar ABC transporter permease n=1 Tax=Rugosimonospora acidiphila TaxID=556531 RepID=A0ABP9RLI1_9ACTN
MLTPQLLGFAAFGLVPILQTMWLSLQQINPYTGDSRYVGIANYRRFATDPGMPEVLRTTGIYVAGITVLGLSLALALAVLVNHRLPGIQVFRTIFFLPALVTLAAWTLVWRFVLQPQGLLDQISGAVGLGSPDWLNTKGLALASVIVLQVLKGVGINMVILLAALQAVPTDLKEAAYVEGASRRRIFWHVTLPSISPQVFMVGVLLLVGSFQVFEQILLLTGGGPGRSTTVLSYYVYQQAFQYSDQGYASALATILFLLIMLLTAIVWLSRRRLVFYESK